MDLILQTLFLVALGVLGFLFLANAIWSMAKLISKHHHHRTNNLGKLKASRVIGGLLDFAFAANLAFWLFRAVIIGVIGLSA